MTDGQKEIVRIQAAYLNGMALVLFGIGVVSPLVAWSLQPHGAGDWPRMLTLMVTSVLAFVGSWQLHLRTYRVLSRLDG